MVSRHFNTALEAAEIARIYFHDFRHTYCDADERPEGKRQIYPKSARTFEPNSDFKRICSPDETDESGSSLQAGKAIFYGTGHKIFTIFQNSKNTYHAKSQQLRIFDYTSQ